ncbi:hypothetical protein K2X96_00970 [Patescibacteria group bacterium]|nr:hypothetical protein [Patescibacteria group bacterium]
MKKKFLIPAALLALGACSAQDQVASRRATVGDLCTSYVADTRPGFEGTRNCVIDTREWRRAPTASEAVWRPGGR